MYIFMYIASPYDVKDVHYSISKSIHLHKMYYISGRWRREEGAAAPMIKTVVVVGGALKSARFDRDYPQGNMLKCTNEPDSVFRGRHFLRQRSARSDDNPQHATVNTCILGIL